MPNHVHFIFKEVEAGGIALFMQKLFTGYTMYFNKRNDRTGALFAGTYKSKHLASDRYFKHAINYVHMNPIELHEPNWKSGAGNLERSKKVARIQILEPARSYGAALGHRATGAKRFSAMEVFTLFDSPTSLSTILFEAQAYYGKRLSSNPPFFLFKFQYRRML